MSDVAIRVDNLSKRYRIGALQKQTNTLRETLRNVAASPFDYLRSTLRGPSEEEILWALKDVSFEVGHGEVVGIIGRNGAGKSTLLKILSRITEPTEGRASINGRVGSLLEVGTGFHPELTGRENIYLNGAILGMKRAEIERKFDEIVAFAEIEKFMDTPVKRYSSGMYVRLAFAVAAHLEPEILLVDEVLAVGDIAFQKKCLGKMGDVAREGRTVLFVSHNMAVVSRLCSRGVLLQEGRIAKIGHIGEVVNEYVSDIEMGESEITFPVPEDAVAYFARFCIRDMRGEKTNRVPHSEPFVTEIEYVVNQPIHGNRLYWMLERSDGVYVMGSGSVDSLPPMAAVHEPGRYLATVRFPGGILNEGKYQYRMALVPENGQFYDYKYGTFFEVYDDTDYCPTDRGGKRDGIILQRLEWSDKKIE